MISPFEGGFETTSGISMAIYPRVGYPLALDQADVQTRQFFDYIAFKHFRDYLLSHVNSGPVNSQELT